MVEAGGGFAEPENREGLNVPPGTTAAAGAVNLSASSGASGALATTAGRARTAARSGGLQRSRGKLDGEAEDHVLVRT